MRCTVATWAGSRIESAYASTTIGRSIVYTSTVTFTSDTWPARTSTLSRRTVSKPMARTVTRCQPLLTKPVEARGVGQRKPAAVQTHLRTNDRSAVALADVARDRAVRLSGDGRRQHSEHQKQGRSHGTSRSQRSARPFAHSSVARRVPSDERAGRRKRDDESPSTVSAPLASLTTCSSPPWSTWLAPSTVSAVYVTSPPTTATRRPFAKPTSRAIPATPKS